MAKNVLPWLLLGAAVVVALLVLRSAPPAAEPAPSPASEPAPPPASARPVADPPIDDFERREMRFHVSQQECEADAQHMNELAGRPPNDLHALHFVTMCIQQGNAAWHKCITAATTQPQAATCNRRLLKGESGP